jgi:hypothetical protein
LAGRCEENKRRSKMLTIKVRRAPDQCRGDLHAVEVVDPHYLSSDIESPEYPGDGPAPHSHYAVLIPEGKFADYAADLYIWFSNGGEGKIAAQEIIPRKGWQLEWLPDPEN